MAKKKKAPTKVQIEARINELSKAIDKQTNKKRPGRPGYKDEFKKLCGIDFDHRAALIEDMLQRAMVHFNSGECSLEEVNKYIRKGIWPLLYQTYADALSGSVVARHFLINKVVANAQIKVEGEEKTPEITINLGEKEKK